MRSIKEAVQPATYKASLTPATSADGTATAATSMLNHQSKDATTKGIVERLRANLTRLAATVESESNHEYDRTDVESEIEKLRARLSVLELGAESEPTLSKLRYKLVEVPRVTQSTDKSFALPIIKLDSAVHQVFGITELVEKILTYLPGQDLLRCQQVSKSVRATMSGSLALNRILFTAPTSAGNTVENSSTPPQLNTTLKLGLMSNQHPFVLRDHEFDVHDIPETSVDGRDSLVTVGFAHYPALRRKGAESIALTPSCGKMYLAAAVQDQALYVARQKHDVLACANSGRRAGGLGG